MGVRGFGLGPAHVDYEKVTIPQIIEHQNANTLVVLQNRNEAGGGRGAMSCCLSLVSTRS